MRWILKTAKAIPIAAQKENPELMQAAFDQIDAALAESEMVCIFPERYLTSSAESGTFRPGVERILQRADAAGRPVPVIPMALRGMGTSMWSKPDSKPGQLRLPWRFRAKIEVLAAHAEKGRDLTSAQLEHRIRELHGKAT